MQHFHLITIAKNPTWRLETRCQGEQWACLGGLAPEAREDPSCPGEPPTLETRKRCSSYPLSCNHVSSNDQNLPYNKLKIWNQDLQDLQDLHYNFDTWDDNYLPRQREPEATGVEAIACTNLQQRPRAGWPASCSVIVTFLSFFYDEEVV